MQRLIWPPRGMFAFTLVWFGQLISLTGSAMTRFALALWAWEQTGLATALALVGFFSFAPMVLLTPFAGALVDRWNRKLLMAVTDLAAGLSTVALFTLYSLGMLEIWHLYAAAAFAGAFEAFQWPAFSAAITTMLPQKHYARASGMLSLAESTATIGAPLLAALLINLIGLGGILSIDIVTFTLAVVLILLVQVPPPQRTAEGAASSGGLWREAGYGLRYIVARRGLLGLQLVFLGINAIGGLNIALQTPLILARTGNNEDILGLVLSAGGVGGVLGGLLMSTWGGPARRVHGVLLGMVGSSLLGSLLLGLGRGLPLWLLGAFCFMLFIPIINASNQAIWQSKVAPDVQGRVFAMRRLIGQISGPLAVLAAGPLADWVFEPAMQPGGALAGTFGWLVGVGPGAGMSLILVLAGVGGAAVGLSGYGFAAIRQVETQLPDHANAAT